MTSTGVLGLETSWKHPKHHSFMFQTPQKHLEKTFFQVILSRAWARPGPSEGPTRARANTWILTFSSKINFGRMNMRKRLLWPEICQFHSQKPYRTCRTLIFNFQRKSEFSLFFSLVCICSHQFHASVQKVPNENVSLNSRRCKILVCRYHYRKAWYLIDLWWCW